MSAIITLEQVLSLANQLSLMDKVRLIEEITPRIKQEIQTSPSAPRKSLRGVWKGTHISEQDIIEIRREMWSDFPRRDV